MRSADHFAHAFGFCIQCRVPKQAPHKKGHLLLANIEINKAVICMSQSQVIKVTVTGEKGGVVDLMQQWNDLPILHPFPANFITDLAHSNTPAT